MSNSSLGAEPDPEETTGPPTTLAGHLEADWLIRHRLRFNEEGKLLRWAKKDNVELVGQTSMHTIGLNVRALTILAHFFCPTTKHPKSPNIHMLRKEASQKEKTNLTYHRLADISDTILHIFLNCNLCVVPCQVNDMPHGLFKNHLPFLVGGCIEISNALS